MGSDSKSNDGDFPSLKTSIDGPRAFSYQHADSQIELVLVHVEPNSIATEAWRTLEVWTANTMYGIDENMRCIEVSSRDPHRPAGADRLIGSRMLGSQRREGDHFAVSFPYPVPGMDAVFQVGDGSQHVTTSKVERVMLRVRMTDLKMSEQQAPDWNKITSVFGV